MKERMKKLKELVTKSKKNLVITIGCTLLQSCYFVLHVCDLCIA